MTGGVRKRATLRKLVRVADRIAALVGGTCKAIVAGIAFELEDPVEAAQELFGVLPTPVGGIEEDHPGWPAPYAEC